MTDNFSQIESNTLALLKELIKIPSITPEDLGCQELILNRLKKIGFQCEKLKFGRVDNLWAQIGEKKPLFCFVCHTDVVPTGDLTKWLYAPFSAEIDKGFLYGRGAADMKSGLAAAVVATEFFLKKAKKFSGSIAFLITSDEEGSAVDGTRRMVEVLKNRECYIDFAVVTEPTSEKKLGDMIKNGRRGSLSGYLKVEGLQGHIAYPHLAKNPVHEAIPALNELILRKWDEKSEFFPETSFQISNVRAGTGANNVIPAVLEVDFNFRFNNAHSFSSLKEITEGILKKHTLKYTIEWQLSGNPFLTQRGRLTDEFTAAIQKICGINTRLDTGGGTSDGRFVKEIAAELIEFGPVNQTIHQINECVRIEDVTRTALVYLEVLENIFLKQH